MEVLLYSKPNCQQCRATSRKLDRLELEYSYTDMSVDESALEFTKSLGYAQAPVVTVKKDGVLIDHWSGFRPDKLEALTA